MRMPEVMISVSLITHPGLWYLTAKRLSGNRADFYILTFGPIATCFRFSMLQPGDDPAS